MNTSDCRRDSEPCSLVNGQVAGARERGWVDGAAASGLVGRLGGSTSSGRRPPGQAPPRVPASVEATHSMDEGIARRRDWPAAAAALRSASGGPSSILHRAQPGGGEWGRTSPARLAGGGGEALEGEPCLDGGSGWTTGHGGAETVEGETLSVLVTSGVAVTARCSGLRWPGWMSRTTTLAAISRQSEIDRVREREQRIWESRKDADVQILAKLKEALGKAEVVE